MLYYQVKNIEANGVPLIGLHGFTGVGAAFSFLSEPLKERPLFLPDLPGHGHSNHLEEKDFSMEETTRRIKQMLTCEGHRKAIICGYSMGGRIAIGFAEQFPTYVKGLILISTSPGIKNDEERYLRKKMDNALAFDIETKGISNFVKYWESLPLFASQKKLSPAIQAQIRKERLSQTQYGLATSLRQIGTGKQRSYWENLATFHFPVLILTGVWDNKFETIANQMARHLPNARHEKIAHAGHALWLERQKETVDVIKKWLKTTF